MTHSEGAPAIDKTVAVIGAGIVGVSTAIWLQREGFKVVLVDRIGPGEGTSYGNAGVLASCSVVPVTVPGLMRKAPRMLLDPDSPLFMRWSYFPKMVPWLARYLVHTRPSEARRIAAALEPIIGDSLEQHQATAGGTGAEKWIVPSDYLFSYRNRADFEADAFAWTLRRELGFSWDELDSDAFRTYDPAIADSQKFAVRLGDHGYIADPGRYVRELAHHVASGGARILTGDVTAIAVEYGAVSGIVCEGETIACGAAVLAAGVWSGALARQIGVNVPMESERGYHVELVEPSVAPRSPTMIASGKFVITPMEGRLRLAGIVEFGGLAAEPSKAPFELLVRQARDVLPDVRWKERRDWMGHRPAPADSIPVIGEVPGAKGMYCGFGHHHVGLTGGPKTGRLLSQIIAGKTPNIDMSVYSPRRFSAD